MLIVENKGYLKKEQVIDMIGHIDFSIYATNRNTNVLIYNYFYSQTTLYRPKEDRLPWKLVEGKNIAFCYKMLFNSKIDDISKLNDIMWNGGRQIMTYEEYSLY